MPTNSFNSSNELDTLQDFLTAPPSWLLNSGMGMMFFISLVVLILSWFIRYPDNIEATVLIRTEQAPVEVVCINGGTLDSILTTEQQFVRHGEPICLLKNTAHWEDIKKLEQIIDEPLSSTVNIGTLQLGDVQTSFSSWQQIRLAFYQFLRQTIMQEQLNTLNREEKYTEELANALRQRKELFQQELMLIKAEYERANKLKIQNIISDQEMENTMVNFLQANRIAHSLNEEVIQNHIRTEQLSKEKLSIRSEYQNIVDEYNRSLQKATQELKAALIHWKHSFLIPAPIDGVLIWRTGLSQGQYLKSNEVPGTIIPKYSKGLIAVCTAPSTGSGRISIGNHVQIQLDAFPLNEYGYLSGKVNYIAKLPSVDEEGKFFYQIKVSISDTLISSFGMKIPFRQNLSGTARIITKERRMLERILGKLKGFI